MYFVVKIFIHASSVSSSTFCVAPMTARDWVLGCVRGLITPRVPRPLFLRHHTAANPPTLQPPIPLQISLIYFITIFPQTLYHPWGILWALVLFWCLMKNEEPIIAAPIHLQMQFKNGRNAQNFKANNDILNPDGIFTN